MSGPPAGHDVVVIGAGVVGCAIARELAHRGLAIALVEAGGDVGEGTSKANTAILHTGFDATPGTVEAALVRRGHALLSGYAPRANIPLEPLGALLVAWDGEQAQALPQLQVKAQANGHHDTRILTPQQVYAREPQLGPGALGALEVPGEGIICPWTTTLAYATEAVHGGVELLLDTAVVAVHPGEGDGPHVLGTARGPLTARYVVNAAGLYADQLDRMFGHDDFTVTPRRGELIVFDKFARDLVGHVLAPVPSSRGKGVLIAPTVYGNVMLGPTAQDLTDRSDRATTAEGLTYLQAKGARLMPALLAEEVTAVYAGLRAATEHADYQLRGHPEQRYVCVGGIRSTGLTASMAIAERVLELLRDAGLAAPERSGVITPQMPAIGQAGPRPYQRAELIAADPDYGHLVCHCERVSLAEIRDAVRAAVPARTVDGVRRRTRAMNGRCQGFFCGARVRELTRQLAPAGEAPR